MGWFSKKSATAAGDVEETRVLRTDARVDDDAALTILLQLLPEGGELREQLSNRFFARAWDKNSNRDYWVESDGTLASCYTIYGLNLKQAAAVRVRWDAIQSTRVLSERVLATLVSAETGQTVQAISFVRSEPSEQLLPGIARSA